MSSYEILFSNHTFSTGAISTNFRSIFSRENSTLVGTNPAPCDHYFGYYVSKNCTIYRLMVNLLLLILSLGFRKISFNISRWLFFFVPKYSYNHLNYLQQVLSVCLSSLCVQEEIKFLTSDLCFNCLNK